MRNDVLIKFMLGPKSVGMKNAEVKLVDLVITTLLAYTNELAVLHKYIFRPFHNTHRNQIE